MGHIFLSLKLLGTGRGTDILVYTVVPSDLPYHSFHSYIMLQVVYIGLNNRKAFIYLKLAWIDEVFFQYAFDQAIFLLEGLIVYKSRLAYLFMH